VVGHELSPRVEGGVDANRDDLTLVCDIGVDVIVVTLF
jgi:hypothetical protein